MKTPIVTVLLAIIAGGMGVSPITLNAAPPAIDRIEYFLGTDPGLGSGTAISLPDASGQLGFSLPVLPPGVHRLHLRARDVLGHWGLTSSIPFRVVGTPESTPGALAAVEYFIGAEPGLGQGTDPAPPAGPAAFSTTVPQTQSLAPGFYRLHLRARAADGRWGLTSSHPFRIRAPEQGPGVSMLSYVVRDSNGTSRDEGTWGPYAAALLDVPVSLSPAPFRTYLERYAIDVSATDLFGRSGSLGPPAHFVVTPPDMGWVNTHFTQAEIEGGAASFLLDSDHDGASNAQEYATLTSPGNPSSIRRPAYDLSGGYFHLRYAQRTGGTGTPATGYLAAGIRIFPQTTSDAGGFSWLDPGSDVTQVGDAVPLGGGIEEITVRQNHPINARPQAFMRVLYR